uniref:Fbox/LRR repeat protein n=1 Tax=Piper nigrum TaxID=13216 RepID=A0A168SQF2_PIPNI|nr:Fbox/LRR repeat protein [Piper nigrum]
MGGACSRKRNQQVNEDGQCTGLSSKYAKSRSSKWLGVSSPRSNTVLHNERSKCPSLMEICVSKICEGIYRYSTLSMLPRDISQQIFNELVSSQSLTDSTLKVFQDCAIQDIHLGYYPGVDDSWMDTISSQGHRCYL